jgi:hypothetical protein
VLIALARSPRLGPVVPLVRGGRQRSEFLGTMTAVLQRGRATHLALRTAHDTVIGELKAQLGIPADADANTLVRTVSRVDPAAGEELAAVLTDVHDALAGSFELSEGLAAELVRRLEAATAAARRI